MKPTDQSGKNHYCYVLKRKRLENDISVHLPNLLVFLKTTYKSGQNHHCVVFKRKCLKIVTHVYFLAQLR